MIAFLEGDVLQRQADGVIVVLGGVGLKVRLPARQAAVLPEPGEKLRLYTRLVVREDELSLYGFFQEREAELFERLLAVGGLGPKGALALLSVLTVDEIAVAIQNEDLAMLTRAPGIGRKTALRILLDLKDSPYLHSEGGSTSGEAFSALEALGLTAAEAASVLSAVGTEGPLEDVVRRALRYLGQDRAARGG